MNATERERDSEASVAGRYAIERELGRGGMGAVYAAFDDVTGKLVALKRLNSNANARSAALFEREYQTLASLRHPAIVAVYDFGRDTRGAYYTMELIEGRDLSQQAPLPWRETCLCLRDVASILGLLHARKLVHRDLSPRNLLRGSNGRLKLIDFGALAAFGVSKETVGTPPFVAPEALNPGTLDQRSDLFALGALGYWLLTGTHAFAARSLKELARLWERPPALPSSLVQLLGDQSLGDVPPALDELLLSLLRIDPAERPSNTTELIDRLNAVADLEPESQDSAIQGYLNSKVLVGRERERERIQVALREVRQERGQALLFEGEPGVGRTRILAEAEVLAQLAGLITLRTDAGQRETPYSAANALCLLALDAMPELAKRVLGAHAPVLGRLSETLHRRLGSVPLAMSSGAPGEDRARAQNALRALFLQLSKEQSLALLVDDLHAVDEESQGLFATLAHESFGHALLLVATAARAQEPSPAMLSYRGVAARLHLLPLSSSETLELLHSVFSSVPYLERLAERLHRVSAGSPAHTLELAEYLVRTGAARYEEGQWMLPSELPADSLPASRHAGHLARVTRLSNAARSLARLLSVPHHGALSRDECQALSDDDGAGVASALAELVREGMLQELPQGYRFTHTDLQTALQAELLPSERERAHRVLAEKAAARATSSTDDALRAAIHFLRAKATKRAYPLIKAAADRFTGDKLNSELRVAAPLFEEIYQLLEANGDDLYARAEPLAVLALAGYFIDRRYAARYGDRAVETLTSILKLRYTSALTRMLGRKLGLVCTLVVAGIGLRMRSRRAPVLKVMIRRLLSVCSALAGTAAVCIDPDRAERLAQVIEPFTVLGPNHAASVVHRFTCALATTVRDRLGVTSRELKSLIERLESREPIVGLDDGSRLNYLAGCYFSLGTNEGRRLHTRVLELADRIEQFSPMYAMSADRLREIYHVNKGNNERAEYYRKRVELHAVQLGSAWQVETWAPIIAVERALRTHDALILKRGVQELTRLAREIPSLASEERTAHGTYLVMRGKYEEALPLLEAPATPLAVIGWTRTRGTLAMCLNALKQHERARLVCQQTLALLTPEDLLYPVMSLNVRLELALAEAALGNVAVARAQLDEALEAYASGSDALTLGLVHTAYVRLALQQADFPLAHEHLDRVSFYYRPTEVPSLLQALAVLSRDLSRAEHPEVLVAGNAPRLMDDAAHLITRVQLVLNHNVSEKLSERAQRALQIALELSSADEGFLLLQGGRGTPEIYLGAAPSRELVNWAKQQLHAATMDDQTVMTEEEDSEIDSNYIVFGRMRYCAATLTAGHGAQILVVGTLVLGFDGRVPRMPEPEVLATIAQHLCD